MGRFLVSHVKIGSNRFIENDAFKILDFSIHTMLYRPGIGQRQKAFKIH